MFDYLSVPLSVFRPVKASLHLYTLVSVVPLFFGGKPPAQPRIIGAQQCLYGVAEHVAPRAATQARRYGLHQDDSDHGSWCPSIQLHFLNRPL